MISLGLQDHVRQVVIDGQINNNLIAAGFILGTTYGAFDYIKTLNNFISKDFKWLL